MQPRKAPRRSRRSGNPRKCQAQGPTHNASPAVLPEAWRGRGRWLRAGGGSEARTPVPALLAPRCVLQFRLHTQPRANSGRPSPAPTQVDPAPRQLRWLSAQPASLTPATSEQSRLGATPFPSLFSCPHTHLCLPAPLPMTHGPPAAPLCPHTHTHTPLGSQPLSPSRGLTKEANPSNHGSWLPAAQLTLA